MIPDRDFQRALAFTLRAEGGFSDKKSDAGGETNHGITQHTFEGWLTKHKQPIRDALTIRSDEIEAIYDENYWLPSGCHELPPDLALCVFDFAVTSGTGRAVSKLQRICGASPADGLWGVHTLTAVEETIDASSEDLLCKQYLIARDLFVRAIARQDPIHGQPNLKGWLNRNNHLRTEIGLPTVS